MAKRYEQMLPLIDELKPRRIIEIGTHRAVRAQILCRRALEHRPDVSYLGYDVFDTMGADFQEAALNGKGEPTKSQALAKLQLVEGQSPGFTYKLVVGDTRQTLHGKRQGGEGDFAFIDGDHRIDAIRGEYEALADCPVVVFDDYYRVDSAGRVPDLSLYGANAVVDELAARGMNVEILPAADQCKHGGVSHLAVVRR